MHTRDAAALLSPDGEQLQPAGTWLDLGAGAGTFTVALAGLLPAGSTIEAVDTDAAALRRIPRARPDISIVTSQRDFAALPFSWSGLAGILMANALHFVAGQEALLGEAARALVSDGTLLIVEYDTDTPRAPWVPYPVSARSLARLARDAGLTPPELLGRRTSRFGGDIYAARLARRADGLSRQREGRSI